MKSLVRDPPPGMPGVDTVRDLKEAVERHEGRRGDRMNKRPTVRELLSAGVITEAQAKALSG